MFLNLVFRLRKKLNVNGKRKKKVKIEQMYYASKKVKNVINVRYRARNTDFQFPALNVLTLFCYKHNLDVLAPS